MSCYEKERTSDLGAKVRNSRAVENPTQLSGDCAGVGQGQIGHQPGDTLERGQAGLLGGQGAKIGQLEKIRKRVLRIRQGAVVSKQDNRIKMRCVDNQYCIFRYITAIGCSIHCNSGN